MRSWMDGWLRMEAIFVMEVEEKEGQWYGGGYYTVVRLRFLWLGDGGFMGDWRDRGRFCNKF